MRGMDTLRTVCLSPSGLAFFGLTPEHRMATYNQIHEIIFHGKGGYDWNTVYHMPVWLRNYIFNKIKEFYDKQNEQQSNQTQPPPNTPRGPGVKSMKNYTGKPTYTSKAPSK
jgi:hypothetical protein